MTPQVCGRCDTPLFLTESKRDGFCDDHRGNTPALDELCVCGHDYGDHGYGGGGCIEECDERFTEAAAS